MADLDFPTAPTIGQSYTAPNGQTYVWDGVTWVVSHAAGGDLTGFYPNPTIGTAKVLRTALATTLQASIPPTPDDPFDTGKVATVSGGITVWTTPANYAVAIGPTAPPAPTVGKLWWRTTDGNLYIYYDDGSSAQFVPAMASVGKLVGGQFYLIAGSLVGAPTAATSLGFYVAALAFTLPVGLTGSEATAEVAASAQTDLTIKVNDVTKGTIRWAAGATVATFIWTSAVAIAVGDRIEILAVSGPDDAPTDLAWTLRGTL